MLTQRRPSVLAKEPSDLIGDALRPRENEHLVRLVPIIHDLLQLLDHPIALLRLRDHLNDLSDAVVGGEIHGANVNLDEIVEELRSEIADFLGPRRRPHQGLTIRTDLRNDLADLRLEAHVKHTISLVEHQVSYATKVSLARLEHVNQAARRGDADLDAPRQVTDLRSLGDTAVDASIADPRRSTKLCDLLLNLDGKFTRRGQHENDGAISGCEQGLGVNVHDGRETVGQRLARAGLGDTDDITTGEGHGPALRLDRSGRRETLGLDLVHNVARKTGLVERLDRLGDITARDGDSMLAAELFYLASRALSDTGMLLVERLLELWQHAQIYARTPPSV